MATIKDIATQAGVSIGTVDRIIHKRGRYSSRTADRVLRIMEELDYHPNIHARGLKNSRLHRFCAVIPMRDQDNGYWSLVRDGILKGMEELVSFGVAVEIVEYDRYSGAALAEALERAASQEPEGLLIAPADPQVVEEYLQGSPVPVICIDSSVDSSHMLSYIGQDSYQSGVLSAKLMSLLLQGKESPQLLIIHPPGNHRHHRERARGFSESLTARIPGARVHTITEEEEGGSSLKGFFGKLVPEQKPDGIFVTNSHVYYVAGCCRELSWQTGHIPLIGYDYIPEGKAMIEDGTIDFIITQEPQLQGSQGILNLYQAVVLNRELEREIHTPLTILTSENLEEYLKNGITRGPS